MVNPYALSTTADSNTSVGGVSIAEGVNPALVNNAMRQMAGMIAQLSKGPVLPARGDVEAATFAADIKSLSTLGYTASGDGGGAYYTRTDAEPSSGGVRSQDRYLSDGETIDATNGGWWALATPWATPEMLGAPASGTESADAALAALATWQSETGGEIILNGRTYGVTVPWALSHNNIKITARGSTGHNTGRSVIQKLDGFTGTAAISIAEGVSNVYGCHIEGVYVNGGDFTEPTGPGDYGEGDGFYFGQISTLTLKDCQAQNNTGYGFHFDGVWVVVAIGNKSRYNGEAATPSGGGIYFNNLTRENNNQDHFGWFVNGNHGHDIYSDDGEGVTDRANALHFFGGQFESGQYTTQIANIEFESGTLIQFSGCQFAQDDDSTAPCAILGNDDATSPISMRFFGGYFQHNTSGPGFAVVTADSIQQLEFFGPVFSQTSSSFINAAGSEKTNALSSRTEINVFGGRIDPTKFRDTNLVINQIGGAGSNFGFRPGGTGEQIQIGSTIDETPIRIAVTDSGSTVRTAVFGNGDNNNLLSLGGLFLNLSPQSAAPSIPAGNSGTAVVALANRTNWDPLAKGSGGAYFVWSLDAGATWVDLTEQGS